MLLRTRTSKVKPGGAGYREDEEMADCHEDEEMKDEEKSRRERLCSLYERLVSSPPLSSFGAPGNPWYRVALQGRGRMGTFPDLECKPFARLLELLDERGVKPIYLENDTLLKCQPDSPLRCRQHPTSIIWVDNGRKPSIRDVKKSIGEGCVLFLPVLKTPQPHVTCKGFDFNTVIYHEDTIKFLEENNPEGFRTYKWVPDQGAEFRDSELRALEFFQEQARRERISPAQCVCEDGLLRMTREHGIRITWKIEDDKFKPCKERYYEYFDRVCGPLCEKRTYFDRVCGPLSKSTTLQVSKKMDERSSLLERYYEYLDRVCGPSSKKITLQVSKKMDGWGFFLDVWKPEGEELKFHFETMQGVEAHRHPVMRHLKHILRPEHLMHPSEPWRDGMHVRMKFELVAIPGNFPPGEAEHEVGHSYVERVGLINEVLRIDAEIHKLQGKPPPKFDGMPRLWIYPLDIIFLGFNGKQEYLSEYQGMCFWGVNLPLDVQVNLLQMLFPVGIGADSPIRQVPRTLLRILEETEADGDLRTRDKIFSKTRSLLATTRKNCEEGIVFSVCAWDIMPHHNKSYQIFEPRGGDPIRRIRTQVKAKPLVNIHLRVAIDPGEPNCISLMDSVDRTPFVHKVYRTGDSDGMRHINPSFFDSLVAAVQQGKSPVIKVAANGITKRPKVGSDGRRFVLSGVLYIKEDSLKDVSPSSVEEVYNDLRQNGHQLKCAAAKELVDKWVTENPHAGTPLKKMEDLLLTIQRDCAARGQGK